MKKTIVAIVHRDTDLGSPSKYSREQLKIVKEMVKEAVDLSVGGIKNLVAAGNKVLIKINTVQPSRPELGYTTDPRTLHALIELLQEANPKTIMIGERSAIGQDTMKAFQVCGITKVAEKTGAALIPFEKDVFIEVSLPNAATFPRFPIPKSIVDADIYIAVPKLKMHAHTEITGAIKIQMGILPSYEWMVECHRDDIYGKMANLTRAAFPDFTLMDTLYTAQGNGPFSPYPEDLVKDFNTYVAGVDPVAVDTVGAAMIGWENSGNLHSTRVAAKEGLGCNNLEEIEIKGVPLENVKRNLKKPDLGLQGVFPNVTVHMGSACIPGCISLLRIQLDALQAQGVLKNLERPLHIFVGRQFESYPENLDGDIIVYGECAKDLTEKYPGSRFYGSTSRWRGCLPIWSWLPPDGIISYVSSLAKQKGES